MLLPLCGKMIIIFTMYIFSLIFEKHELPENMYSAKSSTLTVFAHETFDTACRYYEFLSCYWGILLYHYSHVIGQVAFTPGSECCSAKYITSPRTPATKSSFYTQQLLITTQPLNDSHDQPCIDGIQVSIYNIYNI